MEENGETVASDAYRYGTFLTAPAVYRPGYEFQGWSPEVPESVPAGDMTYTATWKASDGIPYAVRYYVEEPEEGGYTLSEIKTMTGTTGNDGHRAGGGLQFCGLPPKGQPCQR